MVRSEFGLVLFFTCFCLFASGQFHWPDNIPKCKAGDTECIPKTLTQLFRHGDEIPELKIPKTDPFVWKKPSVVRTRNPNAPINIVIRHTNTTIYGLKDMEVTEVKGFGPDPKNTKFELKSFVPLITNIANYKSTMNLFALPMTTEGISNTTIQGMEVRQILDVDVIEKNGKQYLDIKNVKVHLKVKQVYINFDSRTGNPEVNETINKVINENWRDIYKEVKPDLEKNIGEVIKALVKPMFSEIPYKEFFTQ